MKVDTATIPLTALAVLLGIFLLSESHGADIYGIHPVTDKIIAVRILDGRQDNHNPSDGNIQSAIQYTSGLLETDLADEKDNYRLSSEDDPEYAMPRAPIQTGRKSKGIEYTGPNTWHRDVDSPNEYLREHWVYLELPTRLTVGKTYTLEVAAGIVHNGDKWSIEFNPYTLDCPTIHVGLGGFTPDAAKFAYISQWMGSFSTPVHESGGLELGSVGADGSTLTGSDYTGESFHLVNLETGLVAYSGTISKRFDKLQTDENGDIRGPTRNHTNADIWEADFSAFTATGRYRVVVDRMGRSLPFEIREDAYREAFVAALKGIFWQRSGIEKEVYPGLAMPRAHHPQDGLGTMFYDPSYKYWINPEQSVPGFDFSTHPIDPSIGSVYGWYYDAGDWDAYFRSQQRVPLALMMIYNMWPGKFRDGDVGNRYRNGPEDPWIDEGTNGLPDIIDEARWLVDISRNNRDVLIEHGYGTGGIPGYYGRDAGVSSAAWEDARPQALTAEDPQATYNFAATLAYLAYTLNTFRHQSDPSSPHPESATLIAEAEAALVWSDEYLAENPADQFNGTYYADGRDRLQVALKNSRMAAVAALYAATGEASYAAEFRELEANWYLEANYGYWMTPSVPAMGELIYLTLPETHPFMDTDFQSQRRAKKVGIARSAVVSSMDTRGFRLPFTRPRPQTMGEMSTPEPAGPIGHFFDPSALDFRNSLQAAAAYYLGGNQINRSHMTGIGYLREESPFVPNEWSLLNATGMVYRYRNLPGFTVYNSNFLVQGLGSEHWARKSFSPSMTYLLSDALNVWPWGELRTSSRESIAGSEFTIWQLFPCNVWTYGALCEPDGPSVVHNEPPTLAMTLSEGAVLPSWFMTPLTVSGSSDLDAVEYFFNWQFIGRSEDSETGFRVLLDPVRFGVTPGTQAEITALGRDRKGELSWQTPDVDRTVIFSDIHVIPTTAVTITNPPVAAIPVNISYALNAAIVPESATFPCLTWRSSNPGVIEVDPHGVLTAVGLGNATVQVISADGNGFDSIEVSTVYKPLLDIMILNVPAELAVNNSVDLQLLLNPRDTSDFQISWSSSDTSVITIDQNGTISAISPGSAVITAMEKTTGLSDSVTICSVYKPLQGIIITNAPSQLLQYESYQLEVVRVPDDTSERTLTFTSSNQDFIRVDARGLIYGTGAPGSASITVTGPGGHSAATGVISTIANQPSMPFSLVSGVGGVAEWFSTYGGATSGVTGSGIPPTLTTAAGVLNYRSPDYINNSTASWNGVDYAGVYRWFSPIALELGDSLRASLVLNVPQTAGNCAYSDSLRLISMGFFNKGYSETVPEAGTTNEMIPGSDYSLTDGDIDSARSATSFLIGVETGGDGTSGTANGVVNSNSERLIAPSNGMVIEPSGPNYFPANIDYTQPISLTLTNESNGTLNEGAPIYSLTLEAHLKGGGAGSATYTIVDKLNYFVGAGDWSHFVVAMATGTQVNSEDSKYIEFAVGSLSVEFQPAGGGVDTSAPRLPKGLVAIAGDNRVTLSWSESGETDLAGYNVYRSVTGGAGYHLLASGVMINGFIDSTASNGTTYHYVITASDEAANESGFSNDAVAAPTTDDSAPSAPGGLTASAGDNVVSLRWRANSEIDLASYTLYRSITEGTGYTALANGLMDTAYSDSAVVNNTEYWYFVAATDHSGNESLGSLEVSASPADTASPAAPTGLQATVEDRTVLLDWDDNQDWDFSSYKVYRSNTDGSGYLLLASGLIESQFVDTGLTNGSPYFYIVTAVDEVPNESAASVQAFATPRDSTPPSAPAGLSVSTGSGRVSLRWMANSESDICCYSVYRSSTFGSGFSRIASGLTFPAFIDEGLENGTCYYYIIKAVDTSFNESDGSLQHSAIPHEPKAPENLVTDVGTASDWFTTYAGPSAGVDGSGAPATLVVDSGQITFQSASYINTSGATWNGSDYAGMYRAFTPIQLYHGDTLTASFLLTVPEDFNNAAFSTSSRVLKVGFLNSGNSVTVPASGTVNQMTPGSDYVLTDDDIIQSRSATSFTILLETGGRSTSADANGITNVSSEKLVSPSNGMLIIPPPTGDFNYDIDFNLPLIFALTRLPDGNSNFGKPLYSLSITANLQGGGTQTLTYAIGDKENYYVGAGDWTHFAVTTSVAAQIPTGQSSQIVFTISDLVVEYLPAPESLMPFEAWQLSIDWDGFDSDAYADVEPDGLINLFEYAFRSNPLVSDSGLAAPVVSRIWDNGTDYLVLSHRKNVEAVDLTFYYESSSDLESWAAYVPAPLDFGKTTIDPKTDGVEVRIPVPDSGPVFLRMGVDH